MQATPMRYHGPGWNVETARRLYQLWVPGKVVHREVPDYDTGKTRDFWQACWQDSSNDLAGDFYKGQSREDALKIFPPRVRMAFVAALKEYDK
jgi:hypothetical protein